MSALMKKNWYYLSFAAPKFKGAYIVQGTSLKSAFVEAVRLGADPEWHCMGVNITALNAPMPDASYLNRPLSQHDLETMDVGGETGAQKIEICESCAGNGLIEVGGK